MNALAPSVKASLNHALHQAFRPEGRATTGVVFVCGKNTFNWIKKENISGKFISPGNYWLDNNELYVLNTSLSPSEIRGPYSFEDIYFKLERVPVLSPEEITTILKTDLANIGSTLKTSDVLELIIKKGRITKCSGDRLPICVKTSVARVENKYNALNHSFVLVVPHVIARGEAAYPNVDLEGDEKIHLPLIELFPGSLCILHSCRTSYYEGSSHKWYILQKKGNYLHM
jgi:hypothetical protein